MKDITPPAPCSRAFWFHFPWTGKPIAAPMRQPEPSPDAPRQLVTRCDSERHAELVVGASLELGIDPLELLDALDRLEVATAIEAWKAQGLIVSSHDLRIRIGLPAVSCRQSKKS